MLKLSPLRLIVIVSIAFATWPNTAYAQTPDTLQNQNGKKDVEIIASDYLKFQEVNGKRITKLVGNVELKQEGMLMWCDSANLDKETNSVDAWGNVHINQDTVNAWSDYMRYDGNKKIAMLQGRAKLTDSKMKLFTDELFYDTQKKLSYYYTGGRLLKDSTVITSQKGYYYHNPKDAYFQGDVHITDPNYRLLSDTLKYNTETKISTFFGCTEIFNKESRILCDNGWYDSKRDLSAFGEHTVIVNPPQTLFADSLYYERSKGFGRAFGPFQWIDSSMTTEIFGQYGEYSDHRQYIMSTIKPLLIYKMDKDSLFLTADTLKSMTKSETDSVRTFFAYHHTRMFMKSMQGICDSLFYSFEDSMFRMYYSPVMWNEDVQMTGDTVYLFTKNKKADHFSICKSGFIISPSGKDYFDQIKGINIFGYFNDNELYRMNVFGNSESLYFGKDDKGKYIGNNKVQSTNITIYFKDKKIDKIAFLKKPDALFTPMKMLAKDQLTLKGFNWQIDKKPKSRETLRD